MFDLRLNPLLEAINPSATLGLMARADALIRSGKDVISLAGGEPDAPPDAVVRRAAIDRIRSRRLSYGPVAGLRELREAIAARASDRHGVSYASDQVIVGNGAKQVLFEALFATCSPGDEVIVPAPYWVSYPAMVKLAGATPVIVSTTAASGYKLTSAQLAAVLTPHTRWVILNSPSNPTGAVYSAEELKSLGKVVNAHSRVLILCDDIYEDIVFSPAVHCAMATAAPERADRIVTCSGFSKGQAMTGLRVGYAIGPEWIVSAMGKLQSHFTSGGCVVGQAAATAALASAGRFPRERLPVYARRRDIMLKILAGATGLDVTPPAGAFYGWIGIERLLGSGSPGGATIASDIGLSDLLLVEAGLAVVPGQAFGAPGHLRLSFACDDRLVADGCRRLVEFSNGCGSPSENHMGVRSSGPPERKVP